MNTAENYKGWHLFDELPSGWVLDKTCGSPLAGYEFISDGKSILRGGKRALLRVLKPQKQLCFDAPSRAKDTMPKPLPAEEKPLQPYPAKTVNELARAKFKQKLLNDILCDLMICEIEGWGKMEYINEMKRLINDIGSQVTINA